MMLKKINYLMTILFLGTSFVFVAAAPVQAADVLHDVCKEGRRGSKSTVCNDRDASPGMNNNPIFGTNGVLTKVINIISVMIGIAAVIMIILGGFKFITSGSNPQDVSSAREMVLYAVVGLVVAAMAQVIVRFVLSRFFG